MNSYENGNIGMGNGVFFFHQIGIRIVQPNGHWELIKATRPYVDSKSIAQFWFDVMMLAFSTKEVSLVVWTPLQKLTNEWDSTAR